MLSHVLLALLPSLSVKNATQPFKSIQKCHPFQVKFPKPLSCSSWSPCYLLTPLMCRVEASLSRFLPLAFTSLGSGLRLQSLTPAQVLGGCRVTQPGLQVEHMVSTDKRSGSVA